jgi:uroporphyrinogen decarboxylase
MTSRELVKKVLDFEIVDRIPIETSDEHVFRSDVGWPEYRYGRGKSNGTYGAMGRRVDEWGCVWEAGEEGVKGEIRTPLMPDWSTLNSFEPPWNVLKEADLSTVNQQCDNTGKFMVHMWGIEPFQRMQYVRGTEQLFIDLMCAEKEVYQLRDMIHEFYMQEVKLWAGTNVDAIHLEDDWGTQKSLLISPDLWREFFKPLYKDYCDIAHAHGKYVLMHSDGNIVDILPDLIEIGVNAVNAQLDCMDVPILAERFHGKIAFWGGFDRQYLLPFGTVPEVREEVRRIAQSFFKYGRTGLVGMCAKDKGHKDENVAAVYDEWSKI